MEDQVVDIRDLLPNMHQVLLFLLEDEGLRHDLTAVLVPGEDFTYFDKVECVLKDYDKYMQQQASS